MREGERPRMIAHNFVIFLSGIKKGGRFVGVVQRIVERLLGKVSHFQNDLEAIYRVTHHVDSNLLLTSKPKVAF